MPTNLIYIDKIHSRNLSKNSLGEVCENLSFLKLKINFNRPELANWRRHLIALVAAADAGKLFDGAEFLNQQLLEQELLSEFVTFQPSNIQQFTKFSQQLVRLKFMSNGHSNTSLKMLQTL